ncbi:MAG: histidine kinase [Bifidobacteriaceae bacterium]|nr:histidine kinase [Bifidobacteriaceae bacterium]
MDQRRAIVGQLRRHPVLADSLLATALGVGSSGALLAVSASTRRDGLGMDLAATGPGIALTILAALALSQWRRRSTVAVITATAACAVSIVGGWEAYLVAPALLLTLYGYAVRAPRTRAVVATVGVTLVIVVAGVWGGTWEQEEGPKTWAQREGVVPLLWTATAVAVAVRSRRDTVAALEDRARRAEESRDETARRHVAEERVRIARELHDVIAHHVAVMSVQSGVAEHLVERDPGAAREALAHVRASSRAVLAELQSVLGVLRQEENALPTAPAPGAAGIESLVASFQVTGTRVETRFPARAPDLSSAAGVAAFRLVQEALTNVQKHAAGAPTVVRVETQDTVALVEVTNGPALTRERAASPTGSGLGLVGMRERVLAAGGALETGPTPDGGFRVAARLPLADQSRTED